MSEDIITENVVEFIPLLGFENDYEILNNYPFTIRRKKGHYIVSEWLNSNGYPAVCIKKRTCQKHILIAKQFIPNDDPEHKTEVDHINHNRTDYHIDNLRWVTKSDNQKK